jgi:hypothetical protein
MAIDSDAAAAAARRKQTLLDAALTLLVDRAGGELVFTEADYQAVLAKYGGPTRMNMHFEVTQEPGSPATVRLVLEEKAPANAELVS